MTKRKKNIVIFIASAILAPALCLLLVGVGALGIYLLQTDSPAQSNNRVNCDRYLSAVQPTIDRWDDANALASSTSRIALSGPLGELQSIRREAIAMAVPNCADEAHKHLVAYMNATIEGYLAFASQDAAGERAYFNAAASLQDGFFAEIAKFE